MNKRYRCEICGKIRDRDMHLAESGLCAGCICKASFPDHLPREQHMRYLKRYAKVHRGEEYHREEKIKYGNYIYSVRKL